MKKPVIDSPKQERFTSSVVLWIIIISVLFWVCGCLSVAWLTRAWLLFT